MKISDRVLQISSYTAALCGLVPFFRPEAIWLVLAWIVAIMCAFARITFTHDFRDKENQKKQDTLETVHAILLATTFVTFIGGLSAIGMVGLLGAAKMWTIAFITLQLQLTFTQTLRTKRWEW